jgi:2-hydroxy-3-keto-5-methylthiopentenyl-1-phosphate phosphatase
MNLVVLSDFDGTITDIDTGEFVLRKFAQGEWKIFDKMLERGEITLEECLTKQFSKVKTRRKEIISALDLERIFLRKNFKIFLASCLEQRIPFRIVSAGLDFCIKHLLTANKITDVKIICPKAKCTKQGIRFYFPIIQNKKSNNFKEGCVRAYKAQNRKVIFIGDGVSDYEAAKASHISFAVRGSNLARIMKQHRIKFREFSDFEEVANQIRHLK